MPRLLRLQTFARNICIYFRALTKAAFLSCQSIKKPLTHYAEAALLTPKNLLNYRGTGLHEAVIYSKVMARRSLSARHLRTV
jgi:hypothetical protein